MAGYLPLHLGHLRLGLLAGATLEGWRIRMKKLLILLAATAAIILALMTTPRRSRDGTPTGADPSDTGPSTHQEVTEGEAGEAIVDSPATRIENNKIKSRSMVESARQLPADQWLRDWEFTERSGRTVSSQSLRGKPYIASFFFSTCPSVCVKQNDQMKLLQERFRKLPIQLVSITCDPKLDTPERLAEYAKRFEADSERWWFCTGEWDYLRKVSGEVFFHGLRRPKEHIERFLLIDGEGNLIAAYDWHEPAELKILEADVRALVGNPAP